MNILLLPLTVWNKYHLTEWYSVTIRAGSIMSAFTKQFCDINLIVNHTVHLFYFKMSVCEPNMFIIVDEEQNMKELETIQRYTDNQSDFI